MAQLDDVVGELARLQVEHVDITLFHPDENVPMILFLARDEGWYVEAAHLALVWVGLRYLQLHLTVVEVLHVHLMALDTLCCRAGLTHILHTVQGKPGQAGKFCRPKT